MARKVEIEVKVKLMVNMDEGVEVSDIMDEMDYNFSDTTTKADIEDTEILDWTVKNSK
jgi:hypothetical protein